MDYQTLKVCSMVNKAFKALYLCPALDETTFRRVKPLEQNHKLDSAVAVKLHPAFRWLSCKCNDRFEDIKFASVKGNETKTWKLAQTTAAKEYATMPALKKLKLNILDLKDITVANKTGVKVIDVLAYIWGRVWRSGTF